MMGTVSRRTILLLLVFLQRAIDTEKPPEYYEPGQQPPPYEAPEKY